MIKQFTNYRNIVLSFLLLAGHKGNSQNFGEAGGYGLKQASGGDVGTNFATGTIAPAIPLLSLPGVSGGISVGLSYQAGSGVKVNSVASEVGLGWVMSGGGSITREVRGVPDDTDYGWFIDRTPLGSYRRIFSGIDAGGPSYVVPFVTAGEVVKFFKSRNGNEYNYSNGNSFRDGAPYQPSLMMRWLYPASQAASYGQYNRPNQYTPNTPTGQPNTSTNWQAELSGVFAPDNEPDIYTLTLPTGALQFVFDPSGHPVALQAQNIKIEVLNIGNRTYNSPITSIAVDITNSLLQEFLVTTSDGVKYYFGSPIGTSDYKESTTVTTRVLEMASIGSKSDLTNYISKWHLRKIVYPSGEEFNYTYSNNKTYEITTNNYLQQDWVFTNQNGSRAFNCYNCMDRAHAWHKRDWHHSYTVRSTSTSANTKQLTSIAGAQGSILFSYQTIARKDVGGTTNALSRVRLLNAHGDLVRQLNLVQHYADYGSTVLNAMPYDRFHLMLDRIIDKGNGCDYIKAWQFGYDQHAFCRNAATKDYWGYLNSVTYPTDGILVAPYTSPMSANAGYSLSGRNRNPDINFAQYLILQNITSATGSVQSFTYQLNEYNISFSSVSTNYPIGGLRIYRISKYDGISHANDIVDEFTYRKAGSSTESSGCWGDGGVYAKMQLIHDKTTNTQSTSPTYPSGVEIADANLRGLLPYCAVGPGGNSNSGNSRLDYYYMLRSDASMYDYAADYVDYSCVTVSHGTKGKTRYEFTNWSDVAHQDYTDPDTRQVGNNLNQCPDDPLNPTYRGQVLDLPFAQEVNGLSLNSTYNNTPVYTEAISADFPRRSSRSAERGLPLRVTQLTNNDVPVAATINEYETPANVVLPVVNALFAKTSFEVFGFSQYFTYFQLYYYNIASQYYPLKSTTDIVYNQQSGGDITKSVATKTLFEYTNFFPSKVTKFTTTCTSLTNCQPTATGKYYVTEFRRAQDVPSTLIAPQQNTTPWILRSVGMLAPVIEQEQYTTTTLGSPVKVDHLGASLQVYQKLANGHVVPFQTFVSPIVPNFTSVYTDFVNNKWEMVRDASYQPMSTITGYTAEDLPVNSIGRDGIPRATIWGYSHTMPIATVVNGTAATGITGAGLLATSAHTSFEEDGQNGVDGDGWSIPPLCLTEAKTGSRSSRIVVQTYQYGSGKSMLFSAGENRHGKITYSAWVKLPNGITSSVDFRLVIAGQGANNGWDAASYVISSNQEWQYVEKTIDLDDSKWNNGLTTTDNLQLHFLPWCISGVQLLVDEVRIHRADAQMQTATYQPLVGKTSSTGVDGRTTYFTYNSDNSPSLVLDHNRDVITKMQSAVINRTAISADFSGPDFGMTQVQTDFFVAELSNCNDASLVWDFGDNTPVVSGATQSHIYAAAGTYQVTLIASKANKGVAKMTKPIQICDPASVQIQVEGEPYIDFCNPPSSSLVTLTANILNACNQVFTYQWQQQTGGPTSPWQNVYGYQATTSTYAFYVPCGGTVSYRCIITTANGYTNEFDPNIEVITSQGTNRDSGGKICDCIAFKSEKK